MCGRCETIASTRSWCWASMVSTVEPQACQNAASRSTAAGSVPFHRRQDAPAPLEKFGKAPLPVRSARCPRSDGRHKVACGRQMLGHLLDDGALGGADIGDDGAVLQVCRDLARDLAGRTDRHGDDDEIGAAHGLGIRRGVAVAELQDMGLLQRFGGAGGDGDMACEIMPADGARQRGADQADADQGDLFKIFGRASNSIREIP
jgi:hypothetical protein